MIDPDDVIDSADREIGRRVRQLAADAGMEPADWLRMTAADRLRPAPIAHVAAAPAVAYAVEVYAGHPLDPGAPELVDEWAGLFHTPPECGDVIERVAAGLRYVVMGRTHVDGRLVVRVSEVA